MGFLRDPSLCWVIKCDMLHMDPPVRFGLLQLHLVLVRSHRETGLPPGDLRCHPVTAPSVVAGRRDVLIAPSRAEFEYRQHSSQPRRLLLPLGALLLLRGTADMCHPTGT